MFCLRFMLNDWNVVTLMRFYQHFCGTQDFAITDEMLRSHSLTWCNRKILNIINDMDGGCRVWCSFTTDGASQLHTCSLTNLLLRYPPGAIWSEYCSLAVFAANTTSYFSVPSGPACNKGRACQTKAVGKGIRQKRKKLRRACGRVTDGRQ